MRGRFRALSKQGMRLVGVAKGVCAHPAVVEAMVSGGVAAMGDSRIDNEADTGAGLPGRNNTSQSARAFRVRRSCALRRYQPQF